MKSVAQGPAAAPAEGLSKNALTKVDAVVMAVAGSAPAYSLSASTAALCAAVGDAGPAALIVAALPMFGISFAFFYLNRWRSDAGAAYSWIGRSISPAAGFMVGWCFLALSTAFMVAASLPAGVATLGLVAPSHVTSVPAATAIGALWFIAVAILTMCGVDLTARFQRFLTGMEAFGIVLLSVGGFIEFSRHPVHPFSWSWFHPSSLGNVHTLMAGMVIATFYYFGWDVSANLSEETRDENATPGVGGLLGMLGVLTLFLLFQVSVQMGLHPEEIQAASANILPIVAARVLPHPLGLIAIVAVAVSTVGTLETQLLQCSRTLFSMARDRVMSPRFGELHPRFHTPWWGTITIGSLALILFVVAGASPSLGKLMTGLINAIGVQVCFYYGATGLACFWHYRRTLRRNMATLLLRGVWPLASALFLFVVLVYQVPTLAILPTVVSVAMIAVGVIPLVYFRIKLKPALEMDPPATAQA